MDYASFMFLRPEISILNDALADHRVVVLYGLPGSGKGFLAERANASSFEKISQLPPTKSKASDAYWFDEPQEKELDELRRTIAAGSQAWLITSRRRLDIKDAKYVHLKALDKAAAKDNLFYELERRGLRDVLAPEKMLPYLLGNPRAISKAVEFLEMNGADALLLQLERDGFAFDPFLKEESKQFWDNISSDGQKTMRIASVFSSFSFDDLEAAFGSKSGITSDALLAMMDCGLVERFVDSARFRMTSYAKMLVSRFNPPGKRDYVRHGKWALLSDCPDEIRSSAEINANTELGVRCLSWLVENGCRFDTALLEPAVNLILKKNIHHSANLLYQNAARRLGDGSAGVLRRYIKDCTHDKTVTEEMLALLAKTEQRFDDAFLHYTNCLSFDLSTARRQRVENNRTAVLWESGRQSEAIDAARKYAASDLGKGGAVALSNLAVMLHNEEDFDAALLSYENAKTRHSKLGDQRYLAITNFDLGTLAHEQGHFLAALNYHEEAQAGFEALEENRFWMLNAAAIASIRIGLFGVQDAFSFADAKQTFGIENDVLFQDAIALYEKIANAYFRVRTLEAPEPFDYAPYTQAPDELRVQARILRHLTTQLALVCDATGGLFSTDPDEVILNNGQRSQSIFFDFVTRHLEGKGETQISGIAKAGWPDEVMTMKSAKNRVHVALSTLRNAGLKEVLQTTKQGYRLGLLRGKESVPLFVFPNCLLDEDQK